MTPIDVAGTVVDIDESALSGVVVFIVGKAPVVADGGGRFAFQGVVPPYDVLVVSASHQVGILYVGLTRADPFLNTLITPANQSEASIIGALVDGTGDFVNPNPAATVTRTHFRGARGETVRYTNPTEEASAFSFDFAWVGAGTEEGTLYALQFEQSSGIASSFLGYGERNISGIDDAETLTIGNIAMNAIGEHALSGTITDNSDDLTIVSVGSFVQFTTGGDLEISRQSSSVASFDHILPAIPGARGCVQVAASSVSPGGVGFATRTNLSLPATAVSLGLPEGNLPLAVSPADGAAGVGAGSELVWQDVTDAVHVMTFRPSTPSSSAIRVITTHDRAVLPDLAPYGVPLPANEAHVWSVVSLVGTSTTDDAAEPGSLGAIGGFCNRDLSFFLSPSRTAVTP